MSVVIVVVIVLRVLSKSNVTTTVVFAQWFQYNIASFDNVPILFIAWNYVIVVYLIFLVIDKNPKFCHIFDNIWVSVPHKTT